MTTAWLIITGPHCAGKSTCASRAASLTGWHLDDELGDRLRGEATTWHETTEHQGLDEFILAEEKRRDVAATGRNRRESRTVLPACVRPSVMQGGGVMALR